MSKGSRAPFWHDSRPASNSSMSLVDQEVISLKSKILWFDDSPALIESHIRALERDGHEVDIVTDVTAARSMLDAGRYDLLILDVMIPTWEDEEGEFDPKETDGGYRTGLAFYQRIKKGLRQEGTRIFVLTISRDQELLGAFENEGLPSELFSTKFALRAPKDLVAKVNEILADRDEQG